MVQHGLRVVAMDLVLAMVQAARSYGRKKGLLGSYVVGNAASLPFCDACFDGVAIPVQLLPTCRDGMGGFRRFVGLGELCGLEGSWL